MKRERIQGRLQSDFWEEKKDEQNDERNLSQKRVNEQTDDRLKRKGRIRKSHEKQEEDDF